MIENDMNMAQNSMPTSKDLLTFNNGSKDSLIVNKKVHTLEDLRKKFKPGPSSVLSQVRDFLPKLAAANDSLQRQIEENPDCSVDIEQLEDESAPHIEMSLALVEQDSSCSSESDTDSSDDDCDVKYGAVTSENIVLPGHKNISNQAGIQLIQEVNKDAGLGVESLDSEPTINSKSSVKQCETDNCAKQADPMDT